MCAQGVLGMADVDMDGCYYRGSTFCPECFLDDAAS